MENETPRKLKYKWVIAVFVAGIACWLSISVLSRCGAFIRPQQTDKDFDPTIPQASLSPSEVVTLQVNSIRNSVDDVTKLKVCYSLASDENRSQTGPFSRFCEMITRPPYDRLANCVDWQLGGTVVDKEFSAVLISTISNEGDVSGFRFILRRQFCETKMCWMTEGVEYLVEQPMDLERQKESGSGLNID